MLKIQGLSLAYKEDEVLKDLNIQAQAGQIHLVTGPSGSGKSSLLKAINGIIPEFTRAHIEGEISFGQIDLRDLDMASRAAYISSVFQNPKNQFFATDTTDEVAFGLENMNLARDEILDRVKKSADLVDTTYLLDRNIFHISGGEKQLVAITSVVAAGNDIYIFDEPSSSLDTGYIDRLREILARLKSMGKIVIVAEHRLYYLIDIVDQIHILDKGQLKTYQTEDLSQDLLDKHRLRTTEKIRINADVKKSIFNKAYNKEADLVFKDFSYAYGKGQPVFDMNLSLEEDITFIIGENGIGDSDIMMTDTINSFKSKFKGFHKTFKQDDLGLSLSSFLLN